MTARAITAWIVPLKGHTFDLEDLPIYLDTAPVSVVKREATYFLQLSASIAGPTHERVGELAIYYLGLVNGAATTLMAGYRPIELEGGFYGLDENGQIASTVIQVGTAELRVKGGQLTVAINGVPQSDPRRGVMTPLLDNAARNRAKADALTIVGRPSPSWSELYLVYELVEANAGRRMLSEGWISKADATLFCRTSNSYTALGMSARHGKDRGDPPPIPMQQAAAVALMRALVAAWLKE